MEYMDLSNKVALITGAARGIGAASAEILSAHGASVVVADINIELAQSFAEELNKKGRQATAVKVDVSNAESIEQMVKFTLDKYKVIDILVNNAGILDNDKLPQIKLENWERVMKINLTGAYLCTKMVIDEMIKNNKGGKIVNMSSMSGKNGGPRIGIDYAASKAGVISITKSFAYYGAPYGITVNSLCPGFIATDMTTGLFDPEIVPMKRFGTPEDVAKVVYFLSSSLSDYVTGTAVDVNGGLLMS